MIKKFIGLLVVIGLVIGFLWWRGAINLPATPRVTDISTTGTPKITVVATFYPLAHFATQVGGVQTEVIALTPPGIEPHEYEPTPQDLIRVSQAKVVLVNGGEVDIWAEHLVPTWRAEGKKVVVMSDVISSVLGDPHIWLDPVQARAEVVLIAEALATVDPNHAADYRVRANQYTKELDILHEAYTTGLSQCTLRDVVVSHDAFNYLAARYHLNLIPIAGLSPEAEPSAKQLAEITKKIKAKKIQFVFFETLASPKLAETLARETGAKTMVLNPIEGLTAADQAAGKNYDILMRENLMNLRTAFLCQ